MSRFNEFRWQMATTLAKWSKYRLYRASKAILGLCLLASASLVGYNYGKTQGIVEGVDFYHSMCYNNGGLVIDEQGRAVVCSPLTQIPKQEMQQGLTKT